MARSQNIIAARRDGPSVVRRGFTQHPLTDLYYRIMAGGWWSLLLLITGLYLVINLVFAALYMLAPGAVINAEPGSFADAFYFSIQTMSTIGYGHMYPATAYAEALVLGEAVAGLLCTALATGLVFAKFARPHARVVFSDKILFSTMDGAPVLMFRVANARGNDLVEAGVHVTVLLPEETSEGHTMRRLHDLELQRSQTPIFALSWLVMHNLDESSPLHGMTPEQLEEQSARIIVTMVGVDATFSQQVHARHIYLVQDFRWGEMFVDVLHNRDDGTIEFDLSKFHDTEPLPGSAARAAE